MEVPGGSDSALFLVPLVDQEMGEQTVTGAVLIHAIAGMPMVVQVGPTHRIGGMEDRSGDVVEPRPHTGPAVHGAGTSAEETRQ
jgi:hypothetical protein